MIELNRLVSALGLCVSMLATTAQAGSTITRVVGDLPARTLTIIGNDLTSHRKLTVTLGGTTLPVLSRSPTKIVTTLPANVGPGSYPLRIEDGPEIDVTLTGGSGDGSVGGVGNSVGQMFMGSTIDMNQNAGAHKWFSPVGRADEAARVPVAVMTPGPNVPVTVHSLRAKRFGLDGLSPAAGNIVVSVVAMRDDSVIRTALSCTIFAGAGQCTSNGSIEILPGDNFVVDIIHAVNEGPAGVVGWNFQVE